MEGRAFALGLLLCLANWVCAQTPVCFPDDKLKAAVEAELWVVDPTPEDMLGLTQLYAGDDGITDLTGLEYATNLQSLELPNNRIRSLGALSGLPHLRTLSLRSNLISDISPLSGLTSLEELDLFINEVSDISALSGLSSLETVNLQRNRVSDLSPLSGLSRLAKLDLHRNEVSNIAPLVHLPCLNWVDLRINPLSQESCDVYIPQMLQQRPGMWLAYYPSMQRRLTLSSTAGGSVMTPGEGEFTFDYGEVVYLQAQADPGFAFSHWSGSHIEPGRTLSLVMDDNYEMRANFLCERDIIYVRIGGSADGLENGTPEGPFDRIQEAIEVAAEDASIIVYPGVYHERISFLGKSVRLIGMEINEPSGTTWPVIDGDGAGTVVTFAGGEDANCMLVGFTLTGGRAQSVGAVQCTASSPTLVNCIIAGNRATDPNGAAVTCKESSATFINCAVTDNYACENGAGLCLRGGRVVVVNTIVWTAGPAGITAGGGDPYIRYSDIKGGWSGRGNTDMDPVFVRTGGWVDRTQPALAVGPTNPNAVWVMGDYHLRSRAGRWDPVSETWVRDRTTSPCIDAGDPRSWVADEPTPNGDVINMGAYGGTAQACKSYTPFFMRFSQGGR